MTAGPDYDELTATLDSAARLMAEDRALAAATDIAWREHIREFDRASEAADDLGEIGDAAVMASAVWAFMPSLILLTSPLGRPALKTTIAPGDPGPALLERARAAQERGADALPDLARVWRVFAADLPPAPQPASAWAGAWRTARSVFLAAARGWPVAAVGDVVAPET